jgi:hypothetical protein
MSACRCAKCHSIYAAIHFDSDGAAVIYYKGVRQKERFPGGLGLAQAEKSMSAMIDTDPRAHLLSTSNADDDNSRDTESPRKPAW